jgi:hypothetical protein
LPTRVASIIVHFRVLMKDIHITSPRQKNPQIPQ